MAQVDVAEVRRRIAAASAYAGLSQDVLAEKIGMSRSTYNRRLRELSEPRRREPFLTLIADRCKLNAAFFTVDFARLPELDEQAAVTPAAPPASLDDIVDAVLRRLEERERLEPPGRLGRLHEDDQPTGADRPAAEHPRAEDSR